jgi:hypothetical protein
LPALDRAAVAFVTPGRAGGIGPPGYLKEAIVLPSPIRSTSGGWIRRPSPALLVALAALFLALTGTGVAPSSTTRPPVVALALNNKPESFSIPPGGRGVTVACPTTSSSHKYFAISGGFSTSTLTPLVYSAPVDNLTGWEFGFANHTTGDIEVTVSLECGRLVTG